MTPFSFFHQIGDATQRLKDFRPRDIRDALDKRDGGKSRRGEVYEAMSESATHPTYVGNKLIAPNALAKIGPFFDAELLGLVVNELALR